MASQPLHEVVAFLDQLLAIDAVPDASLNGLQVEASADVSRVGLAVDAAGPTLAAAAAAGCELLVVHHGLFWGDPAPLKGTLGRRVAASFAGNVSVYAAHLPLDLHPEVGNNALLAAAIGAEGEGTFGNYGGVEIGVLGRLEPARPLAEVAGALAAAGCGNQIMWAFGPDPVSRIAVVTGSGASLLGEAVAAGADCFVTGEPRHAAYHEAREAGVNCIFCGHYATETFGVRALGDRLVRELGLETLWIDHPTGV